MKFPLPADTFPPLVLTREDELQLVAVAETVVKNTVDEYNEHLTTHNGVVDERRWKKIKQRDNVRVYRERAPDRDSDEVLATMIMFGSLEGSLDDVMYGVLAPSTEAMLIKSAYVEDGFVDCAVLASIATPSVSDPFRDLSIKWFVKGNPLLISTVMRMRDVLYIDSIGFAQTPNGERIGYNLRHTVEIPGIRELPELSLVRSKGSTCYIFRQRSPNNVEVFFRGVISPQGDTNATLTAASTAEITVSVWKSSYCAEMKKLSRVLSSLRPGGSKTLLSSSSSTSSGGGGIHSSASSDGGSSDNFSSKSSATAQSADGPLSCAQCKKNLSSKFKLPSSSSKEKNCAICASRVCSRCRVQKTVQLPSKTKEKELTQVTKTVCTLCMARILNSSSAAFAVLDARAARGEFVDYTEALAEG